MKHAFLSLLLLLTALSTHAQEFTSNTDSTVTDSGMVAYELPVDMSIRLRMAELLQNDIFERTQVGISIYNLTADSLIFNFRERQCMRPASCQKLITAITALDLLGTSYDYKTQLFADTTSITADSVLQGNIFLRGGLDPLLDGSDVYSFVSSLQSLGIDSIAGDIVLDLSFKETARLGWGWCWDDEAVPLTPLTYGETDGFAHAFTEVLAQSGIGFGGMVREGRVPDTLATHICERRHSIGQVLIPMMKSSNNFYAESMFYQIAAHSGIAYAGRKQAVRYENDLFRRLGLNPDHYQMADGSGLSLYNYVTPQLLVSLLRHAWNKQSIRGLLLEALPIAGTDGTLRRRMKGTTAADNVMAKTGTVEGVSSLAGYCTAANGDILAFAIINNGIRHTSTGRNFQDRVCVAMTESPIVRYAAPETKN